MRKIAISLMTTVGLLAGTAVASDEDTVKQIKNEMTATIPATGAHALNQIRQTLAAELPQGLGLKQQVEQLRAAYNGHKISDRI